MRNETKGYILKEYGAWSVLVIAYLIGLGVSRGSTWQAIPVFIALALLINSKQPFMKWTRRPSARKPLVIFLVHIAVAAFIFVTVFGSDILMLLPLLVFPAAYLALNRLAGEHFVLTEALGFVLLSLAAVLAKFTVTGGVDIRLFVAVALYFIAGVFKVKILLLKRTRERIIMVLYVLFSIVMYRGYHVPLIILLPFVDNLIVAARPYKVKLQTTGWIEVAKSVLFLSLMTAYF